MSAVYKVESGSFLDRIMGWLDFGGDDDSDDSSSDDSGGGIGDAIGDVVDDVSDTVDDAVDAGKEAAGDISEGAGDVADEVSEGDIGGAVDEATDTVEDVASGSADTGSSSSDSSGGSTSSSSGGSNGTSSSGDSFSDSGGSSDPEPTSDPAPDTKGSSGSNSNTSNEELEAQADNLMEDLTEDPIPETQDEVDQRQEELNRNFIIDQEAKQQEQQFLNTRESNLETEENLESSIDNIRSAENFQSVNINNETITDKEEAVNELQNAKEDVSDQIESNTLKARDFRQENIRIQNRFNNDQGLQGFQQELGDLPRSSAELLSSVGIGNVRSGTLTEEAQDFGKDLGEASIEIMNKGQEFGEDFAETVPNPVTGPAKFAAEQTGTEDKEFQGISVNDLSNLEDSFQSGVGTFGTQAGGFFLGGIGGGINLAGQAAEDPGEAAEDFTQGLAAFGSSTKNQLVEAPAEFVLEETGEEVGEAAVGFALAGPAGAAFGATPTPTPEPEVSPEIDPNIDPQAETEGPEPEVEQETINPDMEDLPDSFFQTADQETSIEPITQDETVEVEPGLEIIRPGEGRTIYPDQPSSETFEFEVGEDTAEASATPTEPDIVNDPAEFRGENPETGFTEAEQELVRELRGREDVTIRQGETVSSGQSKSRSEDLMDIQGVETDLATAGEPIDSTNPGINDPEPDQTVIEVEETETGGELIFSVMGPVPQSLVNPEPETEINPQPDIQGPEPELADTSPETDLADVGPEIETETESEVVFDQEPELEPETEPTLDSELDPRIDPVIDQGLQDELVQDPAQEFQQEQFPAVEEEMRQDQRTVQEAGMNPEPDKILDQGPVFEPDPEFSPEPEFEPEPETEPRPDREFERERNPFQRSREEEEKGPSADTEFNPSLGAILFDVTTEREISDDEVFTGTEVRPIPEELEDEFDLPF